MTCSEAKLKLEPCASGRLPPEEKIALEEHLATCEGCRLELELTRAVLGSPGFDGAEEQAPNNPEHAPRSGEAPPPVPNTFEPPTAAEIDGEISFADLSLDPTPQPGSGPPGPAAPHPETVAPTPAGAKAGADAGNSNLWDFEPVDAHRDVGPPEGSLSFANEALTRKREDELKRKATMLRLALWGGGVFGGIFLLGISVWIALAFRQGGQGDTNQPPHGSTTGVTPTPGTVPAPTPTTDSTGVAPAGTVAPSATPTPDGATTPPTTTTTAPPSAVTPGPDYVVQVPPTPGAQVSSTKKPTPKPAPPKPAAKPTPKPVPRGTHAEGGEDAAPSWTPSDLQPAPTAPKPVGKSPGTIPAPGATVSPSAGQTENPPPVSQPPSDGAPGNPAAPAPRAQPAPTAAVPPPATPAPSGDATTAPPASAGVTKPIDRLILATETAAQNQDLVTLRKLKDTWKTLLKSVAGPDRSRSKRGMADCLWAIQEVTGKGSDRKDALAAYRDYVLTAPAGGVDSRSLSRMRYLEESLGGDK